MEIRQVLASAAGWFFTVFFALLGLAVAAPSGSWFAGLAAVALVVITSPIGRKKIADKTGIKISGWGLVILCIVLIGLMTTAAQNTEEEKEKRALEEKQKQAEVQRAKEKADKIADFQRNRSTIFADIQSKRDARLYNEALSITNRYAHLVNDGELNELKRSVEIARDKDMLRSAESMPLEERHRLYQRLSSYEPNNADYAKKSAALLDQIQRNRAAEDARAAAAAAKAELEKKFLSQFSSWDGSNRYVERVVKESMKNPDSYKHVETRYKIDGQTMVVIMTYRGTNSFNAVVPGKVIAKVDAEGRILSIDSVD